MAGSSRSERIGNDLEKDKGLEGVFNTVATFLDDNLQTIRVCLYALGGIGALLIIRHSTRHFKSTSAIPNYMISRNSSIPCGVYDVRQTHILVEHRPRIRRLFSNLGIPFMSDAGRGEAIIRVDFSGVAIANTRFIETEKFLEKVVLDKAISCRLLSRNGQGGIDCLVFRRKFLMFESCVNEELLREGLAVVQPVNGLSSLAAHRQVTQKLLKAEEKAKSWRRGIWKDAMDSRLTEAWQWSTDKVKHSLPVVTGPQLSKVSSWVKETQVSHVVVGAKNWSFGKMGATKLAIQAVWWKVRDNKFIQMIGHGWSWSVGKLRRHQPN